MVKRIALGFSFLFHPVLMPTIGLVILLYSGSYVSNIPFAAKKLLILLFGSGTLLLPLLMIPFVYFRGIINNFQMTEKNQRIAPLAITFIFYLLTFLLFIRVPVARFLHSFMLGSVLALLAALIINYWWKISIHMIGLGGLTGFLIMMSILQNINLFSYLVLAILASGITGTSRLVLQVHTSGQVFVGYLIGIFVMTGCLLLY